MEWSLEAGRHLPSPGQLLGLSPPCLLLACPSASCINCVLSCLCLLTPVFQLFFFFSPGEFYQIVSNCGLIEKNAKRENSEILVQPVQISRQV